jgi:hypothetical protein
MKKILLQFITLLCFICVSYGQNEQNIYDNFKKDSLLFRNLQKKKLLSNRLLVYELGYTDQPGKKIKQFNQIQKQGSCAWVVKDSITNNVKLIVAVSQNSSEEWGTDITIFNFDQNQNLQLIRKDRNTYTSYNRASISQNWISDKDAQPCDFYFIKDKFINNKSYCNIDDIISEYQIGKIALNGGFSEINIKAILNSFGIYE